MPLKTQVCPLSKAMDSDTGDKYINSSDGWIRERVGMRTNGLDGNSLFNNKLKGNVLIDIPLPAGTNKCIGWTPDFKTETILWFVHNSSGNHSILRLFVNTNIIQKVWYSQSGLGLIDDKLSANVVDGRIYWVNGHEKPKSFNIEKAVNYTNSLSGEKYEAPIDLELEILPWIKRPPRVSPDVVYSTTTEQDGVDINFNNLRGKLFQFKYSYVYEDNQESAYSEISKVPLPFLELDEELQWFSVFQKNNTIIVTVNTGSIIVKKINIAVRVASSSNTGDFNLFAVVDKYDISGNRIIDDNISYSVKFQNNGFISSIETEINRRYCDDVPIYGCDLSLLDGKYNAISMPIKGYDAVSGQLGLSYHLADKNFSNETTEISATIISVTGYVTLYEMPIISEASTTYTITINLSNGGVSTVSYSSGEDPVSDEFVRDAIYELLSVDHNVGGYVTKYETNKLRYASLRNPTDTSPSSFIMTLSNGVNSGYLTFKKGQYHEVGIVYNDGFGRYNIVNNSTKLFIPHPINTAEYMKVPVVEFSISSRPPIWAETYRLAYIKNMSYTYFQYVILTGSSVELLKNQANIPTGATFININKAIEYFRDFNNGKVIISDYVWQKGDRIRIAMPSYANEISDNSYEIAKEFVFKTTATPPMEESGFLIDGLLSDAAVLEIFRPNFNFEGNIFYETGDSYPILNPGTEDRSHGSNKIQQSADLQTNATGVLNFGDVYMRKRNISLSVNVVEDSMYSDYYQSDGTNKGRACVKIKGEVKQKRLHRIVKSENFIEDTEYNLLNVFLPQSEFFPVSQSYGLITGIKEVGDVLKVVQEHKETSVYIGKASLKQADGTNITVISDKVFNQGNKYDALYGTRYLRSIAANDRSLYYFDDTTGDFIRSSPNGQASISEEYRMKTYFKAKAEELRISTNFTDIITTIDSDYDEVLITFINGNESETIAFYEKEGLKGFTWKVEIKPSSGVPDNLGWYGSKVYGFLGGKIYQHNVGVLNEFFGHQKGCSISFIVNAGAGDANKFSNIELSSNKNIWDIQFDIEAGLNYPVQKSILKPTIIRSKENRLYSDILKNILGRNNTEDISKLRRGQDMTGETMLVTISSSTSEDVTLKEVEVKFLTAK